jgi:hypothetical protein
MSGENATARLEIRELPFAIGTGIGSDGSAWTRRGTGCKPKLFDEWRPLGQAIDNVGYPGIGIRVDGQTRRFRTHVLVLTMFVGPCPEGCEALHDDDVKTNNRVENLRWGTRSENMKDCVRNGTHVRSLASGRRTLRADQVHEIRRLRREGMTQAEVGRRFGVSQACISSIDIGATWGHLE